MLVRNRFESEYSLLFANGYGTTIWSPLCQGLLTGKYNDGNAPAESRMANDDIISNPMTWGKLFSDKRKDHTMKLFSDLAALAETLDCSQAQLALAWTIANQDTSVAIMGFSKPS